MEMPFFEYNIRYGDTLQSISSRLGMSSEELKLFHNTRCNKMDTVWFENLNGIHYLLVPLSFKTEKQKEESKTGILPLINPSSAIFLSLYNIHETFHNPLAELLVLDYSIRLDSRRSENENQYVLTFEQKDFKSNGIVPDNKMESLSLSCMESIMPVDFTVDDNGSFTGFADHKKMVRKFKEKRIGLEEFFIGDIPKIYLDAFHENIADSDHFLNQFKSTLCFQALFPKMEWFHKRSVWMEKFWFFQNSFPVLCSMETEWQDHDKEFIITVFRGEIMDLCSLQEFMRGVRFEDPTEVPFSGEIVLKYTTHRKSKTLYRAEASLSLWYKDALVQKHDITITP